MIGLWIALMMLWIIGIIGMLGFLWDKRYAEQITIGKPARWAGWCAVTCFLGYVVGWLGAWILR